VFSEKEKGENPGAALHAVEYFMNGIKKIPWNLPFKFEAENKEMNEHGIRGL